MVFLPWVQVYSEGFIEAPKYSGPPQWSTGTEASGRLGLLIGWRLHQPNLFLMEGLIHERFGQCL